MSQNDVLTILLGITGVLMLIFRNELGGAQRAFNDRWFPAVAASQRDTRVPERSFALGGTLFILGALYVIARRLGLF
jgi:hypothetical protein